MIKDKVSMREGCDSTVASLLQCIVDCSLFACCSENVVNLIKMSNEQVVIKIVSTINTIVLEQTSWRTFLPPIPFLRWFYFALDSLELLRCSKKRVFFLYISLLLLLFMLFFLGQGKLSLFGENSCDVPETNRGKAASRSRAFCILPSIQSSGHVSNPKVANNVLCLNCCVISS